MGEKGIWILKKHYRDLIPPFLGIADHRYPRFFYIPLGTRVCAQSCGDGRHFSKRHKTGGDETPVTYLMEDYTGVNIEEQPFQEKTTDLNVEGEAIRFVEKVRSQRVYCLFICLLELRGKVAKHTNAKYRLVYNRGLHLCQGWKNAFMKSQVTAGNIFLLSLDETACPKENFMIIDVESTLISL